MSGGALEAGYARAMELEAAGRLDEAAVVLRELTRPVLTLKVAGFLGSVLLRLGQYAEAEHWLRIAAHHRPEHALSRMLLARVYDAQGRIEPAELEFRAAMALDPELLDARMGLAGLLLSVGRYDEGWPLMETRIAAYPKQIPRLDFDFPEWRGEPLQGRSILIWHEQGFGDQIQMCRFAGELKARGAAHVALACRPPLADLFATLAGADEIIAAETASQLAGPRYDVWSRCLSVPYRLGVTLHDLPATPYLAAPADRCERWRGMAGVGLAWRANAGGFNGGNKTLPADQAQRLLDLGAVSLDPEDTGARDFADTAAMIEQLDLVISIDSAAAHLAGAIGKPVWALLPFIQPDWRWLRDRADSPWYPTMRLYRQPAPGAWWPLIDQVIADLGSKERLASGCPPT